jgi:hypothetical protein
MPGALTLPGLDESRHATTAQDVGRDPPSAGVRVRTLNPPDAKVFDMRWTGPKLLYLGQEILAN